MTESNSLVSNVRDIFQHLEFKKYVCTKCGKTLEATSKPKMHSSDPEHYCDGTLDFVKNCLDCGQEYATSNPSKYKFCANCEGKPENKFKQNKEPSPENHLKVK